MLLNDPNLGFPEVHFESRIHYHCADVERLLQSQLEILIKFVKHFFGWINKLALVVKTILDDSESLDEYQVNWKGGVQSGIFRATKKLCCCTERFEHGYYVADLFPFVIVKLELVTVIVF